MSLKLDFTIVSTEERAQFVKDFFAANPMFVPSKHELDTITNFILYGKDPYINKEGAHDPELPPEKWTNMSARKEIDIPTKYSTWKKKEPVSLEETLESPTFNESSLLIKQTPLKVPRITIDRTLEADIPTMPELWKIIDEYSARLENPNLSNSERYKLRHTLIQLRQQQFLLKDIFKPMVQQSPNANRAIYLLTELEEEIDWEARDGQFGFAPMGLYHLGDARFEAPLTLSNERDDWGYNLKARYVIDFRNPDHIDQIVSFYEYLETYIVNHFDSAQKFILDTLEYYIKNTKLTDCQLAILRLKIGHTLNRDIAAKVNAEYNKTYSINYISTIYRKVCAHISETAVRIYNYYYERINPLAFKQCYYCKKLKLATPEEFTRKTRNSDGLSSKCKECEHKK